MLIPQRLSYILERDQALTGAVMLSVAQFEPWIRHSNLPFFPEYTKHDLDHIEGVLKTAVSLIRDDAWETVTASDAAVLILAVLLHDCALHLSEDGLVWLLNPARTAMLVPGFEDPPWDLLWDAFLAEARRFDGRALRRLFGDTEPIRRPPLETMDLTKRDRLLIGEFLRRHHPRLAQETALFGISTGRPPALVFEALSGPLQHIPALAGLVARSHGGPIRSFIDYLRAHYDVRQFQGVHAVYLMTLLRVGDYLQIESDRAPAQVLRVKRLASPVSQGEWRAHHAIRDVRQTHEDPEAVFVDAFPEDVETYFRVEQWLRGIQAELDASWAVLGEVYGRYEGLNKLGLVLRRVRSSLDDVTSFASRVGYVPVEAAFRTSESDLLKLLIEPLYGNRPEVGIRELIQNGLDAVRELAEFQRGSGCAGEMSGDEADVSVKIEGVDKVYFLIVSDNGIGMTARTVVDFFLTAGASFRRSEEWRRRFEDDEGKARVLRAGRFGVGALASFLIGPEIEVSTRYVEDPVGIEFKASVASERIELRKTDRAVGTTIRIRISEGLAHRLADRRGASWDWYCLKKPSLTRVALGKELPQANSIPGERAELGPGWHRIVDARFSDILWTYDEGPDLVCNGLIVRPSYEYEPSAWLDQVLTGGDWNERFGLRLPGLAVFDPDGHLPLNLQRTELASTMPFEGVLVDDVIKDFLAFALVYGPREWHGQAGLAPVYPGSARVQRRDRGGASGDWFFTPEGFGYLDPAILARLGSSVILIAKGTGPHVVPFLKGPVIAAEAYHNIVDADSWLRRVISLPLNVSSAVPEGGWADSEESLALLEYRGVRFLLGRGMAERLSKLPNYLSRTVSIEQERDGWQLAMVGDCPASDFEFEEIISRHSEGPWERIAVAECYLRGETSPEASPVGARWLEILGTEVIPFATRPRRAKLRKAFGALAGYVEAHEIARAGQSVHKAGARKF